LNCVSPHLCVTVCQSGTFFGEMVSIEVTKLKWGYWNESQSDMTGDFIRRRNLDVDRDRGKMTGGDSNARWTWKIIVSCPLSLKVLLDSKPLTVLKHTTLLSSVGNCFCQKSNGSPILCNFYS
jgi:hypothetical protein